MTTSYPIPPRGLILKLRRARRQLRQLRHIINRYVATNPGEWRREVDDKGAYYLYSFKSPSSREPDAIQFLADEAVHHMRSLLDHIVTAVLEASGRPAKDCQFPIWLDEPKTPKAIKAFNAAIKGVPDGTRKIIIAVQPYKRGDRANTHPLWILNRLDNRFKHTALNLFTYRVRAPKLPGVVARSSTSPLLQSGEVFAHVPVNLNVEEDFEPYITFQIAFQIRHVGILGVNLDTLGDIYNFIRDEIMIKIVKSRQMPRRIVD
jgi:hypothetical protein